MKRGKEALTMLSYVLNRKPYFAWDSDIKLEFAPAFKRVRPVLTMNMAMESWWDKELWLQLNITHTTYEVMMISSKSLETPYTADTTILAETHHPDNDFICTMTSLYRYR